LGAGFTGLAAARRLTELRPRWRVAVIDAQRAGDGASGRSSGFVVDAASFIASMPEAQAARFVRLSRQGIESLRTLVAAHGIDCEWDDQGWIHAAAGEQGCRSLDHLESWLEGSNTPFEALASESMAAAIGTPFYRRGIRLPGSVLVQAGALVRGLATSLPDGVALFESSPVECIEAGYVLHTATGRIQAPRLIVALNAWSPNLGILQERLFPLLTFGSLTRPLTPEEQAGLGNRNTWGVLAQDAMGSSVRRTADQRLLIRNEIHYDRRVRCSARRIHAAQAGHRSALRRRYPALADVPFETTWAGPMGAVPNLRPFFGYVGKDAVATGGFTGAGIAMGTALGALAADLVCGEDSTSLADGLALERPRWLPPQPLLGFGIRWRVRQMNASAGDCL
jgi:glycine/D-amino acid oxidase-like deaminating enzyme